MSERHRNRSRSSVVWKFFTRTETEYVYKCNECNGLYKQTHGSTSNLMSHMRNQHVEMYKNRYSMFNNIEYGNVIEQSDFDELLVQLIVKFRLPFSILDDEQFKRIVLFGRNLTLLSRYTLKQKLEIEKQEKHEMLKVKSFV